MLNLLFTNLLDILNWLKNIFTNLSTSNFNQISVDFHAHLIPSIDDGPKSMKEAIELIEGLSQLGYDHLVATPHIYQAHYPNTKKEILTAFAALVLAVKKAAIPVKLHCAAEYYLDEHFIELMESGEILPICDNFLLVEDDFLNRGDLLERYIFKIFINNYRPILAHPERYPHFKEDPSRVRKLKEMGCLFQINILSLTGYYGRDPQKLAFDLLKSGYVEFISTDLHNNKQLDLLKPFLQSKKWSSILHKYDFQNDTLSSSFSTIKIEQ